MCKAGGDFNKALEWYKKAAMQDHDEAQNVLGDMYKKGKSVPENYSTAIDWYKKAARNGNLNAQEKLKKYDETW